MDQEQIVEDLLNAVNTGRLEETKKLLNSYDLSDFLALSEGYDLLLNALRNEYTEIAELLLSNNCRVNREGPPRNETTPLHIAVIARETKIVQMLIGRQAEINALDESRVTPLIHAIRKDDSVWMTPFFMGNCKLAIEIRKTHAKKRVVIIELLVKSGAYVNASDTHPEKPLDDAIIRGEVDVIEILLNNHADPNARRSTNSDSQLHMAIGNTYNKKTTTAVVQLLLNHGADPNVRNNRDSTPLHDAVFHKNFEVVEILLDVGADTNARDWNNQTPLHKATASQGWIDVYGRFAKFDTAKSPIAMINLLLEHGAEPNVYDKFGKSPFSKCMGRLAKNEFFRDIDEHRCIVDNFLSHGADINGSTVVDGVRSYSPLKSAVVAGCSVELIAYLLSKGADVSSETDYGSSLVYHATKNGDEATVKVLLKHGATMNTEGSNGESILQIAVESGSPGIVEQIFRSFYANNESYTRRVKMILSSFLAERFFERLQSWFKDRAGKNTGITHDQYKEIVKNFLQDAYMYEAVIDIDRDLSSGDGLAELSDVEHIMKYHCDEDDSTTQKNWTEAKIVMLLQSNGIDIDFRDHRNRGSLCYAIKYGDVEITRLCLTGQTKVDTDALNVAVALGRREMVDILLQHDPNIDVNASANSLTPLLCAAMSKKDFPFIDEPDLIVDDDAKDDFATMLVAKGADVNARWVDSEVSVSVLFIAAQNNRVKLVEFLLRLDADQQNHKAIHVAVWRNQLDVIKLLLRCGVDIDVTSYMQETAFDIACRVGHAEIVKFLLEQGASEGRFFEDFILGSSKCSSAVREVIQRHMCRIINSKEYPSGCNLRQYEKVTSSRKLSDFVNKCREEGARMRSEKVGGSNVCFYDIFEKEIDQLTLYARNECICEAWNSKDLAKEFPLHYNIMNVNFLQGQTRALLIDSGVKVFRAMCEIEYIPELVIDCLFSYLNDNDIQNLIEAGSNYNRQEKS